MALKGAALTVNFTAWNTSTNALMTGDSANITMYIVKDGGVAAAVSPGTVTEVDATNMPGVYEIALSTSEMNADFVTVGGTSVTGSVEIMPQYVLTQEVWSEAARTVTAATNITSDASAINVTSGVVDTVTNATQLNGAATVVLTDATSDVVIADAVWSASQATYTSAPSMGFLASEIALILQDTGNSIPNLINGLNDFDPAADTVVNVTNVATLTNHTAQTGDTFALANGATGFSAIDTVVDTINSNVGTNGASLTDLGGMSASMKAEVNAEVDTALGTTTYAEPGQEAPGATVTLAAKIGYLYKAFRNRTTSSTTEIALYNDDATTVDQKLTHSDNGTTYDRGEMGTGP